MTNELPDADLDAIDAWCADALEKYGLPERRIPIWAQTVCEYEAALPTRSIRSSVVALVAALRSERTRRREVRDSVAETVADVLSDWHYAHDDSEAERHIAHGSFTLAHALTHCICFGAGMRVAETFAAELERERTQNLAWRALVDASEPVLSSAHNVLLGIDAGLAGRCVSVLGRIDAARAALSTQPDSVQVHVRRDDGPDDTYLVRRASQEAPKA